MTLPERRKANLVEIAKWAILGALVGGGLTVAYYYLQSTKSGDDDRPPIIVRNGSVEVAVAHPGSSEDKGKLKEDSVRKVWFHEHVGKKPKAMEVSVSGVDSNSAIACGTSGDFFAPRVTRITITYGPAIGITRTLTFQVANDQVEMTPEAGATVKSLTDHSLAVDPNNPETGVTDFNMKSFEVAFKKKPNDAADTPLTCSFAAGAVPQITLMQR